MTEIQRAVQELEEVYLEKCQDITLSRKDNIKMGKVLKVMTVLKK